jgi:hypothetical protein
MLETGSSITFIEEQFFERHCVKVHNAQVYIHLLHLDRRSVLVNENATLSPTAHKHNFASY